MAFRAPSSNTANAPLILRLSSLKDTQASPARIRGIETASMQCKSSVSLGHGSREGWLGVWGEALP